MPYLCASAVVIHYEEALYQVYAPLHLPLLTHLNNININVLYAALSLKIYSSPISYNVKVNSEVRLSCSCC